MPYTDKDIHESAHLAEKLMNPELSSEQVEDVDGNLRNVYRLASGEQVVFRSRNDSYRPLDDNHGEQFALTTDEMSHFEGGATPPDQQSLESKNTTYVVNASPLGVIDLALQLRPIDTPNEELVELRKNIKNHQFGSKETALLDLMSAALFNPSESYSDGAPNLQGLIDVAAALNGDPTKTAELHEKMAAIEALESKVVITDLGDLALEKSIEVDTPISAEIIEQAKGIVLVRATNFEPTITDDGEAILQSASDYTFDTQFSGTGSRAFIPRETIHFSLNHGVESHMDGTFEHTSYTIVSPLDKALERNGRPLRMADVDTYFSTGPGETITLPESIVIQPVQGQQEIVVHDKNSIRLKADGYTEQDIDEIVAGVLNGDFGPVIDDLYKSKETVERRVQRILFDFAEGQSMFIDETESSMVRMAVEEGTIPSWRLTAPLDRNKALAMNLHELSKYIAGRKYLDGTEVGYDFGLPSIVNKLAVNGAIVQQGGEVVSGGMHYTSSSELQEKVRQLSDALDVQGGLHSNTAEERAEKLALAQLYSEGNAARARAVNHVLNDTRLPQRIRRSYIANGLLVASGPKPLPMVDYGGV